MSNVANWIDHVLKDKAISEDIVAFCFNLYEELGQWNVSGTKHLYCR